MCKITLICYHTGNSSNSVCWAPTGCQKWENLKTRYKVKSLIPSFEIYFSVFVMCMFSHLFTLTPLVCCFSLFCLPFLFCSFPSLFLFFFYHNHLFTPIPFTAFLFLFIFLSCFLISNVPPFVCVLQELRTPKTGVQD